TRSSWSRRTTRARAPSWRRRKRTASAIAARRRARWPRRWRGGSGRSTARPGSVVLDLVLRVDHFLAALALALGGLLAGRARPSRPGLGLVDGLAQLHGGVLQLAHRGLDGALVVALDLVLQA